MNFATEGYVMKILRRCSITLLLTVLLTTWSLPAFAGENSFRETFEDAFYGGLSGALVGAAFLVFTKKPDQHLDYIYAGAATGVILGTSYGLAKTAKSMAEIENGKVKFAFPTMMPGVQEGNTKGSTALMVKAELLRGSF